MLLRHATPARNLNNILRRGLLRSYSRGKLPVVWACSPARSSWAVLHVIRRHGGRVESTVVLEIDVPRSWLRRSRKGLWYSARDIPPDRIRRVLSFAELAGACAA
jgi:RNA:NAD 2'-phosphotransferase (TPT1/KptA family)